MRTQIRTARLDAADRLRAVCGSICGRIINTPQQAAQLRSCCESLIADERVTTQALAQITTIIQILTDV